MKLLYFFLKFWREKCIAIEKWAASEESFSTLANGYTVIFAE